MPPTDQQTMSFQDALTIQRKSFPFQIGTNRCLIKSLLYNNFFYLFCFLQSNHWKHNRHHMQYQKLDKAIDLLEGSLVSSISQSAHGPNVCSYELIDRSGVVFLILLLVIMPMCVINHFLLFGYTPFSPPPNVCILLEMLEVFQVVCCSCQTYRYNESK